MPHLGLKETLAVIAVVAEVVSAGIYLWGIYRHKVRPHMFTWIIWGTLMSIAFAAQYAEKSGPGMWVLGGSAVVDFIIVIASFYRGEKNITRSDWVAFVVALSAIPVWQATNNPLWAVVMVSAIDAIAFYPTFRKAWDRPHQEGAFSFLIGASQFVLCLFALEKVTLTTALYPATVLTSDLLLVFLLLYRRRILK